jgi:hypothetical protein
VATPLRRCAGVTNFRPLCLCSWLYQRTNYCVLARASSTLPNGLCGSSGRYLQVRNNDSANGLSLLTRGQLNEATTPGFPRWRASSRPSSGCRYRSAAPADVVTKNYNAFLEKRAALVVRRSGSKRCVSVYPATSSPTMRYFRTGSHAHGMTDPSTSRS